jgi:hypothetical protein
MLRHSISNFKLLSKRLWLLQGFALALAGVTLCISRAHAQSTSAPEGNIPTVPFIDIPKFDRDLYNALSHKTEQVNVSFYDQVSPNKMPERLQKWISAVEKTGGKVDVEPPPNEPVPKSPLFLIGLIGSLWSAIKALAEIKEESVYLAAAKRNVVIVLDRDATRQIVVARVNFLPRAP